MIDVNLQDNPCLSDGGPYLRSLSMIDILFPDILERNGCNIECNSILGVLDRTDDSRDSLMLSVSVLPDLRKSMSLVVRYVWSSRTIVRRYAPFKT